MNRGWVGCGIPGKKANKKSESERGPTLRPQAGKLDAMQEEAPTPILRLSRQDGGMTNLQAERQCARRIDAV
jgi:hypothetical protein